MVFKFKENFIGVEFGSIQCKCLQGNTCLILQLKDLIFCYKILFCISSIKNTNKIFI